MPIALPINDEKDHLPLYIGVAVGVMALGCSILSLGCFLYGKFNSSTESSDTSLEEVPSSQPDSSQRDFPDGHETLPPDEKVVSSSKYYSAFLGGSTQNTEDDSHYAHMNEIEKELAEFDLSSNSKEVSLSEGKYGGISKEIGEELNDSHYTSINNHHYRPVIEINSEGDKYESV